MIQPLAPSVAKNCFFTYLRFKFLCYFHITKRIFKQDSHTLSAMQTYTKAFLFDLKIANTTAFLHVGKKLLISMY